MTPELLWDSTCGTVQGSLSSAAEEALLLVHIDGCRLLRFTPATGARAWLQLS